MALQRRFFYRDIELPDPDPDMNPLDVAKLYAPQYPELATASVVFHDPKDGVQDYELKPKAGAKGGPAASGSSTQTVEFKTSVGRKG